MILQGRLGGYYNWNERDLEECNREGGPAVQPIDLVIQDLRVYYYSPPESCGRTNWTATLRNKRLPRDSITISRSEYPDRVRYEADRMRYLICEISERPNLIDYDADDVEECHICGGTGVIEGKPCVGLEYSGPVHHHVKEPVKDRATVSLQHTTFQFTRFYEDLKRGVLLRRVRWSAVSLATGVSNTTLSRMKSGRHPNAGPVVSLAAWAGLDTAEYFPRVAKTTVETEEKK